MYKDKDDRINPKLRLNRKENTYGSCKRKNTYNNRKRRYHLLSEEYGQNIYSKTP